MADNIVGGLFGLDPAQYDIQQRQQRQQEFARDFQSVQLSPMEQSKLAILQGTRAFGRGVGQLLGGEDPQLQKVSAIKQLSSQFDLTSPTGMRDFARSLQQIAPQEAMMAAKRADELEQSSLTRQKSKADIELQERKVSQDEKLREALSKLPENATDAQYLQVFRQFGSPDQQARAIEASIGRRERLDAKAKGDGSSSLLGPLTVAQKSVDNKFGKEYTEYFSGGGINNLEKNVSELARAIKLIDDAPEGATSGRLIGLADKTGQLTLASQLAADVKDIIGGVAQSNLRQVLGGQFAAKEGEALLQRAYDTGQTKANNLKRLRSLYDQASDTIKDKKAAAQYYEEFGTLKGFKGTKSKDDTPPPKDPRQEALDWIKANPTDPRVPAIKKKLGIQ
jgi:hypothetical protein